MKMSLVINLAPDVETRLRDEAARRGQNPTELASSLLSEMFGPEARPFHETATPEEWDRAFMQWVESHRADSAPVIPLEALRREHLYEDRGL
jgi:hypothetical protein